MIIELVAYVFFVGLVVYMGWFYSLMFRSIDPGIDCGNGDIRYLFKRDRKDES